MKAAAANTPRSGHSPAGYIRSETVNDTHVGQESCVAVPVPQVRVDDIAASGYTLGLVQLAGDEEELVVRVPGALAQVHRREEGRARVKQPLDPEVERTS